MAPRELTGIMVALATPYKADGSIDHEAIHTHVNRMVDAGVHGLVPGGSTGEFTTMTFGERKVMMETVIEAAAGRVPVVAGIGALNTSDALDLARHHAKAGADALMVLPPFYEAPNLVELKGYFKEIHVASGLPLLYYNIPGLTGSKLGPKDLASLSEVGVKYLKDTSGDAPALTELLFGQDKITAFNGWDTLTFYGIAAGAKGSVWGATNFIPELSVALWNALAVEGDVRKGREIWKKIWPICNFLDGHSYYSSAVKLGMDLRGWKTGGVRKPFHSLAKEHRAELAKLLNNAGIKTL
ncbi:hypothetical protein QQS21_003159 [Conoideocrella luteorostrata]|uniref:Dihydrodipicolinate synthase n=1 Tax=Conoideocrella luteorostrata TaxID=1105319 RepID=A0AAJ0CTZ2_9HYPO|nr:hypothetical protein QQS21_003159 [Conoideocrella luteorostrata]